MEVLQFATAFQADEQSGLSDQCWKSAISPKRLHAYFA